MSEMVLRLKKKWLFSSLSKISAPDTLEDLKYFGEEEVDEARREIDVFGRGWPLRCSCV